EHRIARFAADVETIEADLIDAIERDEVSPRNVRDMYVIANAGAVRCRVVGSVHAQRVAFAGGSGQRQRNQVRLLGAILTMGGRGSSGIEVAQTDRAHAVSTVEPAEAPLEHQFRFAVGVDWLERMILGDRYAAWFAVRGGC